MKAPGRPLLTSGPSDMTIIPDEIEDLSDFVESEVYENDDGWVQAYVVHVFGEYPHDALLPREVRDELDAFAKDRLEAAGFHVMRTVQNEDGGPTDIIIARYIPRPGGRLDEFGGGGVDDF